MKRHSSCGDLPKPNKLSKGRTLTKDEERFMIKGVVGLRPKYFIKLIRWCCV